jgi:hypothetical protein
MFVIFFGAKQVNAVHPGDPKLRKKVVIPDFIEYHVSVALGCVDRTGQPGDDQDLRHRSLIDASDPHEILAGFVVKGIVSGWKSRARGLESEWNLYSNIPR